MTVVSLFKRVESLDAERGESAEKRDYNTDSEAEHRGVRKERRWSLVERCRDEEDCEDDRDGNDQQRDETDEEEADEGEAMGSGYGV